MKTSGLHWPQISSDSHSISRYKKSLLSTSRLFLFMKLNS